MDFRTEAVYPLFAVFDKRIGEASRLNLGKHGIGIRLDRKRSDLNTIVFLRCGRRFRRSRIKQLLHIGAEGVHRLAMLREPVHDVAVVAGNAERVTLAVADDVLLCEVRADLASRCSRRRL